MQTVGLRLALRRWPGNSLCRRVAFSLVAFAICITSSAQTGQSLSKQDIVGLKNAGIDKSVIIEQIQKDGISFEMNAATTIELKKLGISDDVLSALLAAKTSATNASPPQGDSVAGLYKAGKFPELADRLKTTLKANPSDYKTEALLIMTLLKMKENDAAHAEFQLLVAHDQDPAAAPYVKQVKTLLDSLQAAEEAKQKLIAAVKDYRVADAYAVVDQLRASTVQKEILKINLDMYQGEFDQARDRFSKIPFGSYSEKEHSQIPGHIAQTEAEYKKVMSRINWYLYPPLAPIKCGFPLDSNTFYDHELLSQTVKEYTSLVNTLTQLAPLRDGLGDLTFHAQLLTGQYDKLELLGDHLLKASGSIRIPFYASDRFFQLVVDSRKKRIYTEADPHPYEPKLSYGWWTGLVPFDLAFDQITSISQKAEHAPLSGDVIERKSFALKLEPSGVAPNYGLMNILYCTEGERAELTVTRNLGRFVLHVIGNSAVKANLADPTKAKGPSSGLLTGLLVAGASLSSDPGLRDTATQGLLADQAQQIANYQGQQVAWESFETQDAFDFAEADAFTGLEELLGVMN